MIVQLFWAYNIAISLATYFDCIAGFSKHNYRKLVDNFCNILKSFLLIYLCLVTKRWPWTRNLIQPQYIVNNYTLHFKHLVILGQKYLCALLALEDISYAKYLSCFIGSFQNASIFFWSPLEKYFLHSLQSCFIVAFWNEIRNFLEYKVVKNVRFIRLILLSQHQKNVSVTA